MAEQDEGFLENAAGFSSVLSTQKAASLSTANYICRETAASAAMSPMIKL